MNTTLNILYTCDNSYLPLTSISMASVISNNQDSDICFYLATESEDNDDFKKLVDFYSGNEKVKIKYIDCKRYDELLNEKKLDKWGSNSYYVYWKLFAYDNIDADNIWYLDSDVICMSSINNPQLSKNKAIGAVIDSAHYMFNRYAHINEDYYFYNTGALYIDINLWKNSNCINKVVDYIRNMKYKPLMCDQDILASSLQNVIEPISPKYNYFVGYDYYGVHNSFKMYSLDKKPFYKENDIEESKNNIIFYHFLGGVFGRPWQKNNNSPKKEVFDKYRLLSCWPNFETNYSKTLLFRIQSILEILPKELYNRIHNLAQRLYVKSMANKAK